MADRNSRIRFCHNNMATGSSTTQTYSGEVSPYIATNVETESRYDYWSPDSYFDITSSNKNIYIYEDSEASTASIALTEGTYTASELATELQTKINAGMVSSTWTVTYSTSTYKFTLATDDSNDGLTLTNQTNPIWDTIGFTTSSDVTGASFTSDEVRVHTNVEAVYDLNIAQEVTFFALIAPLDTALTISTNATVKIQGNNVNSWSSPQVDVTVTRTSEGYFDFLDDIADTTYRYWRVYIEDRENTTAYNSLQIGYIYIGDYDTITARNVQNGFRKSLEDKSQVFKAKSGAKFFNTKPKITTFKSMTIPFLVQSDRESLEQMFYDLGISNSFFISLDPTEGISSDLSYLTKYVRFTNSPTLTHIKEDIYSMSFEVEESV